MTHEVIVRRILSMLLLAASSTIAAAQAPDVDLELVLAVDVSRSMDFEEQRIQRDGYSAAFRHPEVLAAIASGPYGRIAVTYFEWAGPLRQSVVVPWTIVASPEDAFALADKLDGGEIEGQRGTSISGALAFAIKLFETSGVAGIRRAIDVSGDGPNNTGPPVADARDQVVAMGITINGLPIMLRPGGGFGGFGVSNLDVYYEDCVIGGPGAFLVTVTKASQFPAAIRRKLVLEIAGDTPRAEFMQAAILAPIPRIDCMIGEQLRERWLVE